VSEPSTTEQNRCLKTTNLGVRSSNLFGRASNINDLSSFAVTGAKPVAVKAIGLWR
jgi:hypothetical protein